MSRRRFLGQEPRQVTTHEYDDAGRLIRSVTVSEPEWDDDDRAWAFALAELEADRCHGCGQPLSESTAVGADDDYDVRVIACHACATRERRAEDLKVPGGMLLVVRNGQWPPLRGRPGADPPVSR